MADKANTDLVGALKELEKLQAAALDEANEIVKGILAAMTEARDKLHAVNERLPVTGGPESIASEAIRTAINSIHSGLGVVSHTTPSLNHARTRYPS